MPEENIREETQRRRTFAIISHPDAGKTTLTEKFLLYSGNVAEAGSVKSRKSSRSARSDWMAMEQDRGISVASTVLQFTYRDHVVNLLDTPGHRDFSEDTYRVLAAVDAAVMVLDAAKGIEAQTLKLFEVCKARNMPILTFLNKWDRPSLDPLELMDRIEQSIGVQTTPVTWPVGPGGDFRGVIDRRSDQFVRFTRTSHGATMAPEEVVIPEVAEREEGDMWLQAAEEVALLDEVGATHDEESFLAGQTSPLFVGSALTNFGVRHLLDAVIDLAPTPGPREAVDGATREISAPFSAFVFKVQANMDPSHRDRVAFMRINSGYFERGMQVTHERLDKPFSTKFATSVFGAERDTVDDGYPGDVLGLVNANDLRIGDTLYVGESVAFPPIPRFEPELFWNARPIDVSKTKQFRKGLNQLDEEGVVQVLRDIDAPTASPVLGAVGQMQFEVFAHRLEHEFGAKVEMTSTAWTVARRTDIATAERIRELRGTRVLSSLEGVLFALFDSTGRLARTINDNPGWTLERVVETVG
ncbi:MAG: peptide chain release factor 3 [Acidimicrobiales bacterium]|nr:peptide chain release factor 3 [Acidimicrobiales bacterium]